MEVYIRRVVGAAFFVVLAELISPGERYAKQIRLICAVIFVASVLVPLAEVVFNADYSLLVSESELALVTPLPIDTNAEQIYRESVLTNYRKRLTSSMEERIGGGAAVEVAVSEKEESFGEIISVTVTGGSESSARSVLTDFYNVRNENIYYQSGGDEN